MAPNFYPWYVTSLVYLIGVLVYRVQKATGWCAARDIEATTAGTVRMGFKDAYAAYWSKFRFVVIGDFISQVAVGLAWSAGLLTEILEAVGVTLPDTPSPGVWYPLVFSVAYSMSGFISERLKNQVLRKMDTVAPMPPGP